MSALLEALKRELSVARENNQSATNTHMYCITVSLEAADLLVAELESQKCKGCEGLVAMIDDAQRVIDRMTTEYDTLTADLEAFKVLRRRFEDGILAELKALKRERAETILVFNTFEDSPVDESLHAADTLQAFRNRYDAMDNRNEELCKAMGEIKADPLCSVNIKRIVQGVIREAE